MSSEEFSPERQDTDTVEPYVSLRDAAELTGYAMPYLRRLVKEERLAYRGSKNDPFISWSEVRRLNSEHGPFWQVLPHTNIQIPSNGFLLDKPFVEESHSPNVSEAEVSEAQAELWIPNTIEALNCIDWLKRLPHGVAQTVVTSPPYWGQRRYADEQAVQWMDGEKVAYGREATVEGYVRHTLEILRYLKRALQPSGTIWWVIGDTYQTRTIVRESTLERWQNYQGKLNTTWAGNPNRRISAGHPYLKDKDLTLVPFLVAHGAQHLGFYVRAVIIWSKQQATSSKPNQEPSRSHMPEPVKDRPTTGHEYILLLAQSDRYYYSTDEPDSNGAEELESLKNLRTVWSFPVSTNHGGHTAAFPIELAQRCIRLSTRPGDLVIDPFAGSGNTLLAAKQLDRQYTGTDISPTYVQEARRRLETANDRTTGRIPKKRRKAKHDPQQLGLSTNEEDL